MPMTEPAVTARDLVLGYGTKVALGPSSFEIPRAQVTAVIGPNGSGKSTLLHAIAGLTAPTSGTLETTGPFNGHPRIAYVLQTTKVNEALPISVSEVVMMGRYADKGLYGWIRQEDRDAVARALDRVGLGSSGHIHLADLSGGQRQRAFVAQGLAQDHDILLLDEPMNGIDLPAAHAIDRAIHEEVEEGCTVVMTTHDLSEARVADFVLLLSGRVVASGPPSQVLTKDHLLEAYESAQLHIGDNEIFVDDSAHVPVAGRHVHRERSKG
ncbi:MAG: metal ABC transporter ATP-binding protein [Acidimicrobiia bacterium]|nr:metal ABC transporter ATP-binding protein [Acidimicrobiia bacterium]